MNFGIIGYGRFGKLWAEALSELGKVIVYDEALNFGTLQEVGQADIIFIIVPISEFEKCCRQLKKFLNPNSLVVDCCSVKIYPAQIMQQVFLSTQPLIATHPLFGPDSVKKSGGLAHHRIVMCPLQADIHIQNRLKDILKKLSLSLIMSTPEEHDQQMASSQGLVHFIGRGLAALDLCPQELATPDFQALLNINQMVVNDSWQLFLDMHQFNPYCQEIRKKLIRELIELDKKIIEK